MSGGERKVVLLTSALPNEAKTTLVASLARCVARSGRRVLLIDCDLRKPGIGQILGIDTPDQRKSFLHLEDDGSSEIINVDLASGLHHLTAHANDDGSHDPLDAEAMSQFIARMRPNYDLILIDSPPVLAVSDPLVLSRLADFTLFLVRWNHTPRTAVLGALRKLRSAGVRVGAIALTRANVRRYYSEVYGGINRFGRELTAYYSR
jgi:Mrp family chromosome partitioning ATPase